MSLAIDRGCSHKVTNSKESKDRLALHVNTTPQIADVVANLELHGQWRERHALGRMSNGNPQLSKERCSRIIERMKWRRNEDKLNFWVFSYGTVIGATFAAMQPHRVGRVVIDGVVDTADYHSGRRLTALQDTDAVLLVQNIALYTQTVALRRLCKGFGGIIESLRRGPICPPQELVRHN